jgi:hypothetical protein
MLKWFLYYDRYSHSKCKVVCCALISRDPLECILIVACDRYSALLGTQKF